MNKVKSIKMSWIVVSDIKEAIKFYQQVVGLKLMQFDEHYGWAEMSGEMDSSRLGIAQSSEQEDVLPGQNAVVTFTVENINSAKADMTKKGVRFVGDILEIPGHVKLQTFLDTDGNKFQLVEVLGEH